MIDCYAQNLCSMAQSRTAVIRQSASGEVGSGGPLYIFGKGDLSLGCILGAGESALRFLSIRSVGE